MRRAFEIILRSVASDGGGTPFGRHAGNRMQPLQGLALAETRQRARLFLGTWKYPEQCSRKSGHGCRTLLGSREGAVLVGLAGKLDEGFPRGVVM